MQEILDYVMYHLKQVDLDKRLYGGIILTGGGAQLKHITQLTEFVTGLGARIGYPNEHLAGGHDESLLNPMYSTCIGLIMRGYHDYESGRLKFTGNNGNYLRITEEELKPLMEEVKAEVDEEEFEMELEMATDHREEARQRARDRSEKVKKLFDGLKWKFMKLFEDVEDMNMED
jgi:cell division protein FtsA